MERQAIAFIKYDIAKCYVISNEIIKIYLVSTVNYDDKLINKLIKWAGINKDLVGKRKKGNFYISIDPWNTEKIKYLSKRNQKINT